MTSSVPYAEVIGDPIDHSKSPLIHRFWLQKLGIEGDYRATRVEAGRLGAYLSERQQDEAWRGCSVTMPHKRAAMAFADGVNLGGHLFPLNLLSPREGKLQGSNTDLLGITEALGGGIDPAEGIVIVGSGAAAETALMTLSDWTHPITLVARDVDKAKRELGELTRLAIVQSWEAQWPPAALLVNASPLGMRGYPPFPFALDRLKSGAMVFDMVYAPLETDLLRRAAAVGHRTVDGLRMLVGQARHQFNAFFGTMPPQGHDEELRGLLTA